MQASIRAELQPLDDALDLVKDALLHKVKKEQDDLMAKNHTINTQIAEKTEYEKTLTKAIQDLETEKNNKTKILATVKDDVVTFQKKLDVIKNNLSSVEKNAQIATNEIARLNKQKSDFVVDVETLSKQKNQLTIEVNELKKYIAEAEAGFVQKEQDHNEIIRRLEAEAEDLQGKVKDLNTMIKGKGLEITELDAKVAQLADKKQELDKMVIAVKKHLTELEKKAKTQDAQNKEEQERINQTLIEHGEKIKKECEKLEEDKTAIENSKIVLGTKQKKIEMAAVDVKTVASEMLTYHGESMNEDQRRKIKQVLQKLKF